MGTSSKPSLPGQRIVYETEGLLTQLLEEGFFSQEKFYHIWNNMVLTLYFGFPS
jgi:hypothetical protein